MRGIAGLLLCVFCACSFAGTEQTAGNIQFKTLLKGEKQIFSPGEKVPFVIDCVLPKDLTLAAWTAFAYEKSVPQSFASALKLKATGKDPRWRMIRFMKWQWAANAKEGVIDTKKWPEGDYRITICVLIRKTDKREDKTDRYLERNIEFTLEKP